MIMIDICGTVHSWLTELHKISTNTNVVDYIQYITSVVNLINRSWVVYSVPMKYFFNSKVNVLYFTIILTMECHNYALFQFLYPLIKKI